MDTSILCSFLSFKTVSPAAYGAQDFSNFLGYLRVTINHRDPATRVSFCEGVRQLLDDMAHSPQLREDCFAICITSTEECEDRVTATYQQMALPRLSEAVRRGNFDADQALPDFLSHARSLYRRDVLADIAYQAAKNMQAQNVDPDHDVDPVEVHLAYQVGLNEALGLQLEAAQMMYATDVTQADLHEAERTVKESENKGFVNYLVNHFEPLSALIHRQSRSPRGDAAGQAWNA